MYIDSWLWDPTTSGTVPHRPDMEGSQGTLKQLNRLETAPKQTKRKGSIPTHVSYEAMNRRGGVRVTVTRKRARGDLVKKQGITSVIGSKSRGNEPESKWRELKMGKTKGHLPRLRATRGETWGRGKIGFCETE